MKRRRFFLIMLSFLIPFFSLIVIFYLNGFFGDNTIVTGDSYAQYYPLFNYLKGVFSGTNSIFYSFNKNLGGTMFGAYFYYLSSPFNLLLAFVSKSLIPLFMTILTVVKISFCGLTMYFYMSYKNKEDNIIILMFSICYALMGYNLNFYVNIMWLDVVLLAPIVLMGVDKIVNKQSPLLYIIFLFISVFSNYYISYMLCIFCVLYFVYEVLLKYSKDNKSEIKEVVITFLISSLLAGLMCSFFLLPCVFESTSYSRSLDFKDIFKFDYNFFDLFSKTYVGSIGYNDILNYSSMNLYCGIIIIPLVYFFVVNGKIPKRERKLTLFFIVFMILPCFLFPLNYIWHLFSKPSFYSYRFSFLLCFFLINIAYKSYKNLNLEKVYILAYLAFYLIISFYFIIITWFGQYYSSLNYKYIWLTLFILMLYLFVLLLKNIKIKKILFVSLLLVDNLINVGIIFNHSYKFSSTNLSYEVYSDIIDKYKGQRIELNNQISSNGSLLMDYYGINNFLSTNNNNVIRFFVESGFRSQYSQQNMYNYNYGQYILDSIVGVKYIISPIKMENYNLIETIDNDKLDDILYVYENLYALSLGYMINAECNDIEYSFNYDEKLYNCIVGTDTKYYKEYSIVKNDDDSYTSIIKNPKSFYIYYPDIVDKKININFDNLINFSSDYFYMKNNEKNFEFDFSFEDKIDDDLKIYYLDYDSFKNDAKKINDQLDYKIYNNKLIGNIDTDGGILMLTIPYEDGYIIKVDGKIVSYRKVLDTFVGLDLTDGSHEIEVDYKQPFLKQGIVLSVLSFGLFVMYIYYLNKYLQKKIKML